MEDQFNASPISEVGFTRQEETESDNNRWRYLLEQQNQNFCTLLQTLKSPEKESEIYLPEFDPGNKEADPQSWLATADMCIANKSLSGARLMITLSKALKGQASSWLSQISYEGMAWCDFKELFVTRFNGNETAAAFLINFNNNKPKDGECLAAFAASQVSALMSNWSNLKTEEIAVAAVLAQISQFESRIQRIAFTTEIKTRSRLQQELLAFSFTKRKMLANDRDAPDTKRFKNSHSQVKCFTCGKMGHKSAVCRSKISFKQLHGGMSSIKGSSGANPRVQCFKCKKSGHYASRCMVSNGGEGGSSKAGPSAERRVDLCAISTPTGYLRNHGETFSFCYDSGSECSLLKESVSIKFSGKRFNKVVVMTGIGQTSVNSCQQILTTVNINDLNIEILFHVLPDFCLRDEILIGREILKQNIAVYMSAVEIKFEKVNVVNFCDIQDNFKQLSENLDTDILAVQKQRLLDILGVYKNNFINGIPNTRVNTEPMQIRLKDPNKTVCRRPYKLSPDERIIVQNKIDELLAAKIIRPSSSPFASPILLVKKKNGSDRMCVDFRELNDNTVPDRFPLPLISDQISRLHGCNYFTTLDMASGFHQIPVHENSIEYTAFVTPDGQYEYLTMPFGLRNAPSVYQRVITNVLGKLASSYVVVYMDDILITAKTVEEGLERLERVLQVLTQAGFSLNVKKCLFLKEKVQFLGFEVCKGEIRPNPKKIEALTALPPPQTVTQLRQFIGLASYFRQFILKFSQIMAPLYALTSNKNLIEWKPSHENIRQKIIFALTNEPVLMIFDPNCPIELHTDASSTGYGAILMQKRNEKLHVVAYYSKCTTKAEAKYHSYELETLAVVNSIKHFRQYLHGRKFIVITDCNSLQSARKKLDLTPRVHRWWAFLQSFDFDIIHRSGKRMSHVDFFSRNTLPQTFTKIEQKIVNLTDLSSNWLLAEQQRDDEILKLITEINENKLNDEKAKTYELRSGILHRKIQRNGKTRCLPIIPRAFRWSVINNVHESIMHLGWEKTLEKVYELYWFENMSKYVRKFVENCITCAVSKSRSGKIQSELHPIPKVPIPWHTVHVDATGKLSGKSNKKEYVFVLIDAFTKYVLLHHTLSIDSTNSIKAVKKSVSLFGAPTRIIADQGRCFASKEFREFCESNNIALHLIATGSPRANGQVERVMSTLKGMLTAVESSKDRSWQDALLDVQLALNCTINRVTKSSPLELMIGKIARPLELMMEDNNELEIDILEARKQAENNIKINAQNEKHRFDAKKAKIVKFSVGDFVLLQNEERNQTKLDPKYRGPFKVVELLEGDRYVLKGLNCNRTYKYAHDRLRKMPESYAFHDETE